MGSEATVANVHRQRISPFTVVSAVVRLYRAEFGSVDLISTALDTASDRSRQRRPSSQLTGSEDVAAQPAELDSGRVISEANVGSSG